MNGTAASDNLRENAPSRRAASAGQFPWRTLLGVVVLALLWRLALAAQMPCMSRDGVTFCRFAQDLAARGTAALLDPAHEQHALYPAAIIAVHHVLIAMGVQEGPFAWQRAGQFVSMVAGLLVIGASGALAASLARLLSRGARGDARAAGNARLASGTNPSAAAEGVLAATWAFAMAAVLPLYCALSVDAMSEPLHVLFYLWAAIALTRLDSAAWAGALGAFAGLAFLTRPEGGAPIAAAALLAGVQSVRGRCVRPLLRGLLAAVIFAAVIAPYCMTIGTLTPKLRKESVEEFVPAAAIRIDRVPQKEGRLGQMETPVDRRTQIEAHIPAHAALTRRVLSWPGAAGEAAYAFFRAGRVVVPLLAIVTLIALRRQWLRPPLLGLLLCVGIHYVLTVGLLKRHGYLDARHTLPVVALLLPVAAMGLAHLLTDARRARLGLLFGGVTLLTLGVYATRVPNAHDAHLARAAAWLRGHASHAPTRATTPTGEPAPLHMERRARLLGGSSQKRVAFYAGLEFVPWPENEPDDSERLAALKSHLAGEQPDWFTIEIDPSGRKGTEFSGNQELLEGLMNDPQIAPRLKAMHRESNQAGIRVELFHFERPPRP